MTYVPELRSIPLTLMDCEYRIESTDDDKKLLFDLFGNEYPLASKPLYSEIDGCKKRKGRLCCEAMMRYGYCPRGFQR